jgi:ABC-type multidrug transport system ATPase subunit
MELRIENLSKTYSNGVRALHGVSLLIPRGMFGLLGPNGAGKSTLMRTIATLQEPDAGAITLDGLDVLRDKDLVRRQLGYLPQEFGVHPEIDAATMLDHLARLKGIANRGERRDHVDAVLQQTNLHASRKRKLREFSGGMKQRFGIAQALLGHPRLIIVDEPTAGLDPEERHRFLNLLSAIGETVIVILSTHIVDDVKELCSRMAIIDQGVVLRSGEPAAAVAELRGLVWRRVIAKEELPDYRERYQVLSGSLLAGRVLVHVLSPVAPGDGFEATEPGLEDVYFAAVRSHAF